MKHIKLHIFHFDFYIIIFLRTKTNAAITTCLLAFF